MSAAPPTPSRAATPAPAGAGGDRPRGDRRGGDRRHGGRRNADLWARRARRAAGVLAAGAALTLFARLLVPALVVGHARTETRTLVVGGRPRTFRLHHPAGWDPEQPLPLVLAFHGHEGTGRVLEYESRLDDAADRARVLGAYPDGVTRFPTLERVPLVGPPLAGLSRTWNVGTCCAPASAAGSGTGGRPVDDVAFAAALVRTLAAEGSVEPRRVYATGFSIGGTLALRLACDRAGLVAAVASVEGTMPDVPCAPARPVPVWLVRGGEDAELRADLAENREEGGRFRAAESMRAALTFWGRQNGCAGPVVRRPGPRVATEAFAGCPASLGADGAGAALLLVHGNAHAWPGGRRPYAFAPPAAPDVPLSRWVVTFFLARAR